MSHSPLRLSSLILLAATCLSTHVQATPRSTDAPVEEEESSTLSAAHIRVSPATGFTVNAGWSWARLGVAFDLLDRGTIEVGSDLAMKALAPELHWDLYARGGLAWVVLDTRDGGPTGWVLQPLALVGYRYLPLREEGEGLSATQHNHCATIEAGLATTAWVSEHVGLDLHLTGGVWLPFARTEDANWNDPILHGAHDDFYGDLSFSIGLALR